MPNYDYKCLECGHVFEVFQSMTADPIEVCEKCGGKVKRLIGSGAGIIFKGSGFYETDYKKAGASGSNQSSESKAATESKPASDTTTTKTETKSAAKE